MVLFLEGVFYSKVAPTEKLWASVEGVVCLVGLGFGVGWPLIFKFHRVFSSYGFIPAFAQEDQFH